MSPFVAHLIALAQAQDPTPNLLNMLLLAVSTMATAIAGGLCLALRTVWADNRALSAEIRALNEAALRRTDEQARTIAGLVEQARLAAEALEVHAAEVHEDRSRPGRRL